MKEDLLNANNRNSKRYYLWQLNVFEKDNYCCQRCGINKELCAHHVIKWNDNKDLRFEVTNGLTLCRACHIVVHAEMGDTGMSGRKHSEYTKNRIKSAKMGQRKGIKIGPMSEETKKKLSILKTGIKLGPMPEETKEKIRASSVGKKRGPLSDETKNKMREAHALRSHINGAIYRGKTWHKCPETGKRIWDIK